MTKAIAHTYNIAQENWKTISTALLGLCAVLALGYVINIFQIVSHTVALKQVQTETSVLQATVQKLDTEYAELSSKITPDVFASYGFDVGNKIFISRTTSLGQVSMVGNEL